MTAAAAIRDALIDEERDQFERAYREAPAEASDTLDEMTALINQRLGL